jgi:hypothetical protein
MSLCNIPDEILVKILSLTDLKTISSVACCNTALYLFVSNYKWDIIDRITNSSMINNCKDSKYLALPNTLDTYLSYEYIIDLKTLIMYEHKLPDNVIIELERYIDFNYLFIKQKVSETIVRSYYNKVAPITILKNQKVPIDILYDIINRNEINSALWSIISSNQTLDFHFVKTYESNIDWRALSSNKKSLVYDTIICYKNLLVIPEITRIGLSEEVIYKIIELIDAISWINISYHSKLSNKFINNYLDKLSKIALVTSQKLTEDTILKIIDKTQDEIELELIWLKISECQALSYDFIIKYKEFLNRNSLIRNRHIKRSIIHKYEDYIRKC